MKIIKKNLIFVLGKFKNGEEKNNSAQQNSLKNIKKIITVTLLIYHRHSFWLWVNIQIYCIL